MNAPSCVCGSRTHYDLCCSPLHLGTNYALTAEQLMRSRYSAYALGRIDYIEKTNGPEQAASFDFEASLEWSKQSNWIGLEIISTREGEIEDSEGLVEFTASYSINGKKMVHHEVSLFMRLGEAQKWFYIAGENAGK